MPEIIKKTLRAVSPALYRFVRNRYRENTPYNRLARRVGRRLGWKVACGPFAGMKYLRGDCCERSLPKLLGSYEQELWPVLRRLRTMPVSAVINIGCAEGYYAVGLARLIPGIPVYAFDCLPSAREATRRAAEANGVAGRMRILGACDAATLSALPLAGALVVIDCEGAETDILDPSIAPGLRDSWILVELHDFVDPRITAALRARFDATHEVEMIGPIGRDPSAFPPVAGLKPEVQALALDEDRRWRGAPTPPTWAFMRPRRIRSTDAP